MIASHVLAKARGGILAVLLMLVAVPAAASNVHVDYMVLPQPWLTTNQTSDSQPEALQQNDVFFLPGYGHVRVSWVLTQNHVFVGRGNYLREMYYGDTSAFTNGNGNIYYWNTDPQIITEFDTPSAVYDFKLEFLDGPPDVGRLLFVTVGLGTSTTAAVSQPIKLVGQMPYTSIVSKPVALGGGGTVLKNSDVTNGNSHLALARFKAQIAAVSGIPTVTIHWTKSSLDGVGFTLGWTISCKDSLGSRREH